MPNIKKKYIPFFVPALLSVIAFFYIPSPSEFSDENHVYVKAFDTYMEVLSVSTWLWVIIPFFLYYIGTVYEFSKKRGDLSLIHI